MLNKEHNNFLIMMEKQHGKSVLKAIKILNL